MADSLTGLLGGKLSIILQSNNRETNTQLLESSHVHLLLEGKIPNGEQHG